MVIQEIVCSLFMLVSCPTNMEILLLDYLLVPSVILIIILYGAVNMFLAGTTLKIKGLLAIVFYIVVVRSGLYAIFAPIVMPFLTLWLLGMIALFFGGKIFNKKWVTEGPSRLAKTVDDWKGLKDEVSSGEKKEEKRLKEAIEKYNNMIEEFSKKLEKEKSEAKKGGLEREIENMERVRNELERRLIDIRLKL